uniref:RNase H type-1 domain-containing protein n=1 Tax=Nicotiana tabacum TaxID=4097 RepID=A0A1S4BBS0_TOBAC|nr:PREDICTED: uncharacterized protein LOC107806656 [Nicotiana tabacum]
MDAERRRRNIEGGHFHGGRGGSEAVAAATAEHAGQSGSSMARRSELGIVLKPPTGSTIRQSIKTSKLTNNEAEHKVLIAGLELAKSLGVKVIKSKCDSQLVVNQVNITFEVREDRMQRRMLYGPLAKCLGPGDTDYVLREIYKGICGNHFGVKSLVYKVIKAGYYWINMEKDTKEFVRKCDKCQRHAPMIHKPGE